MKNKIVLFLILLSPFAILQLFYHFNPWGLLLNSIFCFALLVLLINASNIRAFKNLFYLIIYLSVLTFSLVESILFDFTGSGFTNEVFFHMGAESLRIGFAEYQWPLVLAVVFLLVLIYSVSQILRHTTSEVGRHNVTLALVGLTLSLWYSSPKSFISQYVEYHTVTEVNLDKAQKFVNMGVINPLELTTVNTLKVETTVNPKNLILIYLESFNEGLIHLEDYPELTPQLKRLTEKYQTIEHVSSSYVTIEGIISSQCGTMLPMTAGNNTFNNQGDLMSQLPCLGDVLKQSGYTQYFLGGAVVEFAGKGAFLESHGYDHVFGWEHWKEQGTSLRQGNWGLSDAELFEEALQIIRTARNSPPYNMTLLTLGTHLPGLIYEECQDYLTSDEPFIKAINCTDQLLGSFVATLESEGLLENTLLFIVSDHGVFPTTKMTELFAGVVDDRKLLAITNHSEKLPPNTMSSYDLFTTVTDLLAIKHNAKPIFGRSIFHPDKPNQRFVTRYADWLDAEMVINPPTDCTEESVDTWPMSTCDKRELLGLTNFWLNRYSGSIETEVLACEVAVKLSEDENGWALMLDESDHFDHFISNGFKLNRKQLKPGMFVISVDDERRISKHIHFKDVTTAEKFLKHNSQDALIVDYSDGAKETIEVRHYDADHESLSILQFNADMLINVCEDA